MSKPDIIQMYNRTFLVTDRDENGKYMQRATAQAITPAVASRRSKAKEIPVQHDALAKSVMAKHGFTEFEDGTEASVMKINGIDTDQKIRIFNGDISILTKEQAMDIIRYIDTEAYITLIETAYNNSWMNVVPTFDENVNPLSDDSILTLDNIQQFANTEDKSYPTVVKLLQEANEVVVA